jgi:hypothetical protein
MVGKVACSLDTVCKVPSVRFGSVEAGGSTPASSIGPCRRPLRGRWQSSRCDHSGTCTTRCSREPRWRGVSSAGLLVHPRVRGRWVSGLAVGSVTRRETRSFLNGGAGVLPYRLPMPSHHRCRHGTNAAMLTARCNTRGRSCLHSRCLGVQNCQPDGSEAAVSSRRPKLALHSTDRLAQQARAAGSLGIKRNADRLRDLR